MDFVTLILISVIGVVVVGLLGFAIPAGLRKPFLQQEETIAPEMPKNLPAAVRRWLEVTGLDQTPGGDTVAWGSGKMAGPVLPLIGRVWMPLRWSLHLQPGKAFVWRAQITWWRRRFISGGDMLYDGQGIFDMGGKQLDGDNLNASQFTLLWIYSLLLTPLQTFSRPGLVWKNESESAVTLQVPLLFGDVKNHDFTLHFDPGTGQVQRIDTLRTTARKGDEQPFYAAPGGAARDVVDGSVIFHLPENLELGWEDFTFQRLRLVGLANGVSGAEDEIARGIRI